MSETTFENAKVGDTCWSSSMGEAEIEAIYPLDQYPIKVRGKIGRYETFTFKGSSYINGPQCLFWSKPEIIAPERPKKLVKKVVKVRPWKDCHGIIRLAANTLLLEHENSPLNCGPEQTIEVLIEE